MLQHAEREIIPARTIALLGAVGAATFWIAEGVLHSLVFDRGVGLHVLLPATGHEWWMRSLIACAILAFALYAQRVINKLRESTERYRALFENAPDATFLVDVESGQILNANPAASRLLLRPHEEIVGLHQSKLHPPEMEDDSRRLFARHIEQAKRGESMRFVEHVALRSDGAEVPVEIAAQVVYIGDRPTLQGIFRDLTERKKAQRELECSNERLRAVLDGLDALVYVSDMGTGEVLFANKYGRDTWGDIVGKTCWKVLQSRQTGPCEFCTNSKLIDCHGEPAPVYQWELQNAINRQWYECHDQAIRWTDGRLVRMEIAANVTARKQTQETLRRQTELLESIRSAQSLFITDSDPAPVFESLLNTLVRMTDSECGFLDEVLKDQSGHLYKRSLALSNISWDEESRALYEKLKTSNMEFRNLSNLAGAPALTSKLVISNDPAGDPRSGGLPEGHPCIRSFMGIPMFSGGELIGIAGVANRKGGYNEQMASFLEPFVSTCAGIIQAIREKRKEQRMADALKEEARLQQILLDSMPCVALLLRPGTREIVASNKAGLEAGAVPGKACYQTWAKSESPCPWCLAPAAWATGQAQHLEPCGSGQFWDAHWIPISEDLYMHYAFDITERKKAEQKLVRYQTQLRSLVSQLATTEERERKKIEGALHDDLLQRLVLCKMKLDGLSQSEVLKDHADSLNQIAKSIREMIRSARSLTFDLASPVLYDIGLEAAIRDWLDREVNGKYSTVFQFEDDGQPRQLGTDLRVTLYRTVRELCTNIVRHSQAKRATVSVRSKGDEVEIVVEDDGIGIERLSGGDDPGDLDNRGGLGLFGIRERLDHFGASMKIDSQSGTGTRISIVVPPHSQETAAKMRN